MVNISNNIVLTNQEVMRAFVLVLPGLTVQASVLIYTHLLQTKERRILEVEQPLQKVDLTVALALLTRTISEVTPGDTDHLHLV